MLDANLRQSPLAHLALLRDAKEARQREHGIGLAERPFRAIVDLRARDEPAQAALEAALGLALPRTANRVGTGGTTKVLWLGPDQWWAVCDSMEGPALTEKLSVAAAEGFVAVTDVSEYYTTLAVEGPRARDLLAKGCPLDLHPRLFEAGCCAQSLIAKAPVLLELLWTEERNSERGPRFEIFVRRSFAEYLWRWLADAAGEYGLTILRD